MACCDWYLAKQAISNINDIAVQFWCTLRMMIIRLPTIHTYSKRLEQSLSNGTDHSWRRRGSTLDGTHLSKAKCGSHSSGTFSLSFVPLSSVFSPCGDTFDRYRGVALLVPSSFVIYSLFSCWRCLLFSHLVRVHLRDAWSASYLWWPVFILIPALYLHPPSLSAHAAGQRLPGIASRSFVVLVQSGCTDAAQAWLFRHLRLLLSFPIPPLPPSAQPILQFNCNGI